VDHQQALAGGDGLGDRVGEALGQGLGGLDAQQVLAEDDELIAAVAGDRVAVADLAAKARGDADEQLVADLVSVLVVDRLEAVEIDEEDPEAGPLTAEAGERDAEAVHQELSVRQAGQRVVHRAVLELAPRVELARRVAQADQPRAARPVELADADRERAAVAQRDLELLAPVRRADAFAQAAPERIGVRHDPAELADQGREVALAGAERRVEQRRELGVPDRQGAGSVEHRDREGQPVDHAAKQGDIGPQGVPGGRRDEGGSTPFRARLRRRRGSRGVRVHYLSESMPHAGARLGRNVPVSGRAGSPASSRFAANTSGRATRLSGR
jgi:hypothetical protein